jgi:hypothetical protein
MAEPFRSPHWALWVQPDGPNTSIYYLGCHTLDDVEAPGGGIKDIIRCFKADGTGLDTLTTTRNPPEPITTTVTGLINEAADWLERIVEGANCPFPLYVNGKKCPPYDVFGGAERWYALEHAEVGTTTLMGLSNREEDNISEQAFEITAWPPMVRGRAIITDSITNTFEEIINDITSCSTPRCAGECGTAVDICDTMVAASDADGAAAAEILISYDNGSTWTATAADPGAVAEDMKSILCFPIDADTTRILVAREEIAAEQATVFYSDDWGATWTEVAVGGTVQYGAVYGGALFGFNMHNIWLISTDGAAATEMFFSDDGGETWTEQAIGIAIGYAVSFADLDDGMAVGAADAVYTTTDGGATWGAATATGGGGDMLLRGRECRRRHLVGRHGRWRAVLLQRLRCNLG